MGHWRPTGDRGWDRDRYGRLLRYMYVDGTLVEAELVRLDLAVARAYPPGIRYQERLEAAESEARAMDRGMWPFYWNRGRQPGKAAIPW